MVKYFEYNISFNTTTTPWKDNYYGHLQMKNLNFSILSLYKLINKWQTQNSPPVLTSCIWFSSSTQNTLFFSLSFSALAVISKFENMTLVTCFRRVPLLLNGIKSSPFIYLTPGFSTSSLILTTSITLLWCPVEVFTNSNIDTRRKNQ